MPSSPPRVLSPVEAFKVLAAPLLLALGIFLVGWCLLNARETLALDLLLEKTATHEARMTPLMLLREENGAPTSRVRPLPATLVDGSPYQAYEYLGRPGEELQRRVPPPEASYPLQGEVRREPFFGVLLNGRAYTDLREAGEDRRARALLMGPAALLGWLGLLVGGSWMRGYRRR